jgi:hypothetical protein
MALRSQALGYAPLVVISLLLTGGCIFSTKGSQQKKEAPEPIPAAAAPVTAKERDARVQPAWQARMLKELETGGGASFVEAWGLFSEGGWSDAGQVVVLANADRSRTRLLVGSPNRAEVATDRALTAAEWQTLEPQTKAAVGLDDVNESVFDGIVFELVHARRDGATAKVVDRLFVKQSGSKPHPQHDALVNAFQALRK